MNSPFESSELIASYKKFTTKPLMINPFLASAIIKKNQGVLYFMKLNLISTANKLSNSWSSQEMDLTIEIFMKDDSSWFPKL